MFDNVLSPPQRDLLPFISSFGREFYMAGGTAIALQIGHRQSIGFDLFKTTSINNVKIRQRLREFDLPFQLLFTDANSFHILTHGVKITFFQYPFSIPAKLKFEGIKMPDLLHLAAMKAYALGRRAKWKDYVDLYFILKNHHSLEEVIGLSREIYQELFSEKLFRQQLCYFDDINYLDNVKLGFIQFVFDRIFSF